MAECRFCGEPLSRLDRIRSRSLHANCEKTQLEMLERYKAHLYELASNGNLASDETLKAIVAEGKFSQELIDGAGFDTYGRLKGAILETGRITKEERENLRALQAYLHLDDSIADVARLDYVRYLASVLEGNVPEIETDIRLQSDEVAHYETSTRWCHLKTRRKRAAGSRGTSIRIAKGISVPVGKTQGHTEEWEELQTIDEGRVVITSKRLLFIGPKKNLTVKHEKILHLDLYNDAVAVHRGTVDPTIFMLDEPVLFYTILTATMDL